MRRSRLYLLISIVSLLVAGGICVAQKRCQHFKDHAKLCGNHKPDRQKTKAEVSMREARKAAYAALEARDFNAMAEHATILLQGKNPGEGKRLRAYALRGQARYTEALAAYEQSRVNSKGDCAERPVLCDAHIGRAHCYQMLGKHDLAHEEIEAAIQYGRLLVDEGGDEQAHYQLACAYAVQSGMLEGEQATAARRRALDHFVIAIQFGFDGWDHAAADLDMDCMRADPQFAKLVTAR